MLCGSEPPARPDGVAGLARLVRRLLQWMSIARSRRTPGRPNASATTCGPVLDPPRARCVPLLGEDGARSRVAMAADLIERDCDRTRRAMPVESLVDRIRGGIGVVDVHDDALRAAEARPGVGDRPAAPTCRPQRQVEARPPVALPAAAAGRAIASTAAASAMQGRRWIFPLSWIARKSERHSPGPANSDCSQYTSSSARSQASALTREGAIATAGRSRGH